MASVPSVSPPELDTQDARPNTRLREVREAKHLTIDAVATSLHLEPRIISALESAAYDQLPAPAYVRGYIRNYAALLGIDPARLIDAYNAEAEDAPPLRGASSRPAAQARSTDRPVKFMTYLITATLAVLLGLWLYSEYRNQLSMDSLVYEQSQTDAAGTGSGVNGANAAYNLGYTYPVIHHPATPEPPPPAYAEPETGASLDAATSAGELASSPSGDAAAAVEPAPAAGDLVLKPDAECWVEIYDADGRRLHYGLRHAGDVVSVTGRRPYRVTLGNATEVHASFAGRELDFNAYITDGVARFSVDEQGLRETE